MMDLFCLYLHQAAVEGTGFTLVGEALACELVGPLAPGREPGPVKAFGYQKSRLGVWGYFRIQAAFTPVIEYPHQVALRDAPFLGVLGVDQ